MIRVSICALGFWFLSCCLILCCTEAVYDNRFHLDFVQALEQSERIAAQTTRAVALKLPLGHFHCLRIPNEELKSQKGLELQHASGYRVRFPH